MPCELPSEKVCPFGSLLVVVGCSKVFLRIATIMIRLNPTLEVRQHPSAHLVVFAKLIVIFQDGGSQSALGVIGHC